MVTPLYVATAAVTTLFVLGVVGVVVRGGRWQAYSPTRPASPLRRLRSAARSPAAWAGTFGLLLVVFGGGTVLWVSGASVPGVGLGLAVAAAVAFGGALFVGVYETQRARGRSAAQGAVEGSFLVGLLVVLLIVVKLVA